MQKATRVALASVAGVLWYAFVEWSYFSVQGPHFRKTFAKANGKSVDAFSYRAPWVSLIAYVCLVLAYVFLAILPALNVRPPHTPRDGKKTEDNLRLGRVYAECLWRAVLLSLAVYGTYDLATYATVFSFGADSVAIDMAYGVVVLPVVVVAPVAVLVAASMQ